MTHAMFEPTLMAMPDGSLAFSDSEEYRHVCECRAILAMPLADRRDYLFDLERTRGVDQVARVRETLTVLHEAGKR